MVWNVLAKAHYALHQSSQEGGGSDLEFDTVYFFWMQHAQSPNSLQPVRENLQRLAMDSMTKSSRKMRQQDHDNAGDPPLDIEADRRQPNNGATSKERASASSYLTVQGIPLCLCSDS